MELTALLDALDRTAANLAKLEDVWARAESFMPKGPAAGSDSEYDDLCRAWTDLLSGLPPIDGWTITGQLPDIDQMGRAFVNYFEIDEPPIALYADAEQPDKDLAEYRYRLARARRRAGRERLRELVALMENGLPVLVAGVERASRVVLTGAMADELRAAVGEIERLMGNTKRQSNRWSDLHRHLAFGEGHDWHDIRSTTGRASAPMSKPPGGQTPIRCRCRILTLASRRQGS